MSRKVKTPELRQANLTYQQMEEAIPKIDRRMKDLNDFNVDTVNERSDPGVKALSAKLETLLADIFGPDTVEFKRYHWDITHLLTFVH